MAGLGELRTHRGNDEAPALGFPYATQVLGVGGGKFASQPSLVGGDQSRQPLSPDRVARFEPVPRSESPRHGRVVRPGIVTVSARAIADTTACRSTPSVMRSRSCREGGFILGSMAEGLSRGIG